MKRRKRSARQDGFACEMTQAQVAEVEGISRARVMQLEQGALRKLRAAAEARGITLADVLG